MTNISPSSGSVSTSFPSFFFIKHISLSSSTSSSWEAWYSTRVMTLLLGQSEAMCPRPWHLKHLLGVAMFGGGLFCRVGILGAIWDEAPVGLGDTWGLPLLKVGFLGKGLGGSLFTTLDFFCCSTLWASTHTSSKVVCCYSSTTWEYLGSSPLRYLTMVWSSGSYKITLD